MEKIVECIPNFSEGRRREVVDSIVTTIESVPGVVLLDMEMDADHNRSVITFVGEPMACVEAAVKAAGRAAELIDLNVHRGEHPRIGATDVIPFVPISNVTMDDCVKLAHEAARRIAEQYLIPVYLYEAAATRPDRVNLADIRRGEFEGLRNEIQTNPARRPDYGEAMIHPTAGATVVGARPPLIAYNVNLGTEDVSIAKKIAKAVRFATGGLRYVKALGFELKDRKIVQVSMNMVNYEGTPLFRAFEMIKREAERYGVNVVGSEIVGLVPQAALNDCVDYYLRLENFSKDQILEHRLQTALAEASRKRARLSENYGRFPDLVAAGTPTPGGGSVAAHCGMLSAALGQMMCNLTIGKKKYVEVEDRVKQILDQLAKLRTELCQAIEEDAKSFEAVMQASKLPKDTQEEQAARAAALDQATRKAAEVPLCTAQAALKVLELLAELARIGNKNVLTDVGVGALLAETAVRGAYYNVLVNLASIADENYRTDLRKKGHQVVHQAKGLSVEITRQIESSFGISEE
ncbi:MAG: glutamate formimidoyltransferase [Acidobacteriota bacterium]|nr:glutamate formimidoyltransferase [Blastocatellia bacterium]MDW8413428.1 glutamate formimidoyltransferase [Acidobacteriota bacterium]